jgi:hypothetical protein
LRLLVTAVPDKWLSPILPAEGSCKCKIERPEQRQRGDLSTSSGYSILQPPSVGKIGTEFGLQAQDETFMIRVRFMAGSYPFWGHPFAPPVPFATSQDLVYFEGIAALFIRGKLNFLCFVYG